MKIQLCCFLFWFATCAAAQPPHIHAHNDYQKTEPLFNALRQQVYSIEADVFLKNAQLLVAHDQKELTSARKLEELYLQPIIELYKKNGGTISADKDYAPVLMIDIKESRLLPMAIGTGGEAVIAALIKILSPHLSVFDLSINKKAVQIVLSGSRCPVNKWATYPSFNYFDGRPYETYDSAALQRVAFISDNWFNYVKLSDSSTVRLREVIEKVHDMGRRIRFWAAPDTPAFWKLQQQLSIDIINTDKPEACRKYFME